MCNFNLTAKELSVLEQLQHGPQYRKYFFDKASSFKWFEPLRSKGYFAPEANPSPVAVDRGYRIPYWNTLPYLERLAEAREDTEYDEIVGALLGVIAEVGGYRDENGKCIDNHHTWMSFTKILSQLPGEKISVEILGNISDWLVSSFETSMLTHTIIEDLLPSLIGDVSTASGDSQAQAVDKLVTVLKAITTYDIIPVPKNERFLDDDPEVERSKPKLRAYGYWLLEGFKKGLAKEIAQLQTPDCVKLLLSRLSELLSTKESRARYISRSSTGNIEFHFIRTAGSYQITVYALGTTEDHCSGEMPPIEELEQNCIAKSELEHPVLETPFDHPYDFCQRVHDFCKSEKRLKGKAPPWDILAKLYHWLVEDYSQIWLEDLSSSEDRHLSDADHVVMILLHQVIQEMGRDDVDGIRGFVTECGKIEHQFNFYRRLILFAIRSNWNELSDLFWDVIGQDHANMWLGVGYYDAELVNLFEYIAEQLEGERAHRIVEIIEMGPIISIVTGELPPEHQQRYFKQKWFMALQGNPELKPHFDQLRKESDYEIELPFRTPSVVVGHGKSPYSAKKLLSIKDNEEIAKKLKEFRTVDEFRGPNVNALAEQFRGAVTNDPDRFTENLSPFIGLGSLYIYHLLWAFHDVAHAKRFVDWSSIAAFLTELFEDDDFWSGSAIVEGDTYKASVEWVLGELGQLIQEGSSKSESGIPINSVDEWTHILSIAWRKWAKDQTSNQITDSTGPVNHTANTSVGRLLWAVVALSLRHKNLTKQSNGESSTEWHAELKAILANALENRVVEAICCLGWFYANLKYLDEVWTVKEGEQILVIENDDEWAVFIHSYLFGNSGHPLNLDEMKPFLDRAIDRPIPQWDFADLLTRSVASGYLLGDPQYGWDGAFGNLLSDWDTETVGKVVRFFESQYYGGLKPVEQTDNPVIDRILEFWGKLHDQLAAKDETTETDQDLLSEASTLIRFLSQINQTSFQWLLQVAPYIHRKFNSPQFVEHMERLKVFGEPTETAKRLAKLYKAIQTNCLPDYDQGYIRSTLEFIIEHKDDETHRILRDVFDCYLEGSHFWLQDLAMKAQGAQTT